MHNWIPDRAMKYISGIKFLETLRGTSIPRRIHAGKVRVTY